VRNTARELCAGLAQKDFVGEARRIFDFVKMKIRYLKDIDGIETLHAPEWMLNIRQGDCDDKAILAAALLLSIGHSPVRFIAVAFSPDRFSHVWLQDYLGNKWVDLETTEPLPFGQSVPLRGVVQTLYREV
jgi:predicted transglutaminase-like cysteine proteinase